MFLPVRRFFSLLLIIACIVLIFIFYNMYRFNYGFSDATYRSLFCFYEDTIWADGFSEEKFSKLRIGMNKNQASSTLGDPLRKKCGKTKCEWSYSRPKTDDSSFDRRDVIFNLKDIAIRIRHEFYSARKFNIN